MVENGGTFRAWMAPPVEGIREFCGPIDAVAERYGQLPSASSEAMKELVAEPDHRRLTTWRNPVTHTHMFGGIHSAPQPSSCSRSLSCSILRSLRSTVML